MFNHFTYDEVKRQSLLREIEEESTSYKKSFNINYNNTFKEYNKKYTKYDDLLLYRNEIKKQKPMVLTTPYNSITMNIDFKAFMINNPYYNDLPLIVKNIIVGYSTANNVQKQIIKTRLISDPLESLAPESVERTLRSMVRK